MPERWRRRLQCCPRGSSSSSACCSASWPDEGVSMSTMLEADTLLAVDVGSINTRASLFDVVDGRYRLVATGKSTSTAGPPLFDVSAGGRNALDQGRSITGRKLVEIGRAAWR